VYFALGLLNSSARFFFCATLSVQRQLSCVTLFPDVQQVVNESLPIFLDSAVSPQYLRPYRESKVSCKIGGGSAAVVISTTTIGGLRD